MGLPAGFNWRMGGQQQEMETSFDSMRLALYLAIFLVYLVMASQFESLLHPFVILLSVPLSLIGVLVTLYLFEVRISIVVLIDVVLLAGIGKLPRPVSISGDKSCRRGTFPEMDTYPFRGTKLAKALFPMDCIVTRVPPETAGVVKKCPLSWSPGLNAMTVLSDLGTSHANGGNFFSADWKSDRQKNFCQNADWKSDRRKNFCQNVD